MITAAMRLFGKQGQIVYSYEFTGVTGTSWPAEFDDFGFDSLSRTSSSNNLSLIATAVNGGDPARAIIRFTFPIGAAHTGGTWLADVDGSPATGVIISGATYFEWQADGTDTAQIIIDNLTVILSLT